MVLPEVLLAARRCLRMKLSINSELLRNVLLLAYSTGLSMFAISRFGVDYVD